MSHEEDRDIALKPREELAAWIVLGAVLSVPFVCFGIGFLTAWTVKP